jgi:hypothetical protein
MSCDDKNAKYIFNLFEFLLSISNTKHLTHNLSKKKSILPKKKKSPHLLNISIIGKATIGKKEDKKSD